MNVNRGTENRQTLPSGWRWVKLGEVCRVVGGSTPKTGNSLFWDGDITWITPADLGKIQNCWIETSNRKISISGYQNSGTDMLPFGAVILSSRAPIGYLGIAAVPLCTNQGCKSFIPGENVDSKFLYWSLKSSVSKLQGLGSGATFVEISKSALEAFMIPLPPLSDQKRIAAILDEQMAAVEKARAAAEAQVEAMKALSLAYYKEGFGEITPLSVRPDPSKTNPEWQWRLLKDVARLESGHTPSRYHPEWWGGDIPWLALPDIRKLDGQYACKTSEFTNPDGIANSSARILPAGTVCLSRTASVGYVTILGCPMATSQDFVNWVCGPELDPDFLMHLFLCSRQYFISLASGAIHKTVYMPTVEKLSILSPGISEQKRLAAILNEQMAAAERLRNDLEKQLHEINALPAALLRRAFNGEL